MIFNMWVKRCNWNFDTEKNFLRYIYGLYEKKLIIKITSIHQYLIDKELNGTRVLTNRIYHICG